MGLFWRAGDPILMTWPMRAWPRGSLGVIEMGSNRKRKPTKRDEARSCVSGKRTALDDALKNTFPASDPVSIAQPVPVDTDGE